MINRTPSARFRDPGRKTSTILMGIAVIIGVLVSINGATSVNGTDFEATSSADAGAMAEIVAFVCLVFWYLNFKRLRSSGIPVKKWYLSPWLNIPIALLSILLFLFLALSIGFVNGGVGA